MPTMPTGPLAAVSINDPNQPIEYMLFVGDEPWGWVGRVDINDEFAGFQVVCWDDMTTIRLGTWSRVSSLIDYPEVHLSPRFAGAWQPTADLYAADVLAAERVEAAAAAKREALARQAAGLEE